MNGITHNQAQHFMRAELDGLLTDAQHRDLDTHLHECEACRVESESLSLLTARLKSGFQARWDDQDGPSKNVVAIVRSRTWRISMSNRVNLGIKVLAGMAAVLVFGFLINRVISQMRDYSAVTNETQTKFPVSSDKRLIAFVSSAGNGNPDIYTMYPDGSGLTDLTNNSAHDINPYWSPDGRRIAFQSDRTGLMQIFVMNANGSDVTQLTNDEVNHEFGVSDHGPWSPDGSRLLFTEWGAPETEEWMLYAIGVDTQNKTLLAEVPALYTSPSWSPDGKHIAFVVPAPQEGARDREGTRIHVVDVNGKDLTDVTRLVPADEDLDSFNYSWSSDGQSISFIANRYYYENGNGKSTLYQASLDGNSLVEIDHAATLMGDWWDGTALVMNIGNAPLTWLRSDGTRSTLNAYRNCEVSDIQNELAYKRSSGGDLIIGAGCANEDWWFYWANPDGTVIQQLLNYPVHASQGPVSFHWSPDGKYVALNAPSSGTSNLYMVNVPGTLKDPSTQLVQIPLSAGAQYYNVSWQPIP
jgi:Tol biopolymer transport system component